METPPGKGGVAVVTVLLLAGDGASPAGDRVSLGDIDSPGSRLSGARHMVLLAGMIARRWQGPRPVEVGERGGPYPAM